MYGSPVATPQSVHWWYTHVVGACLRPGNPLSIVEQVEGTSLLPLPQSSPPNFSTGNSLGNTGRGARASKRQRRAGPARANWQQEAAPQQHGQWKQPHKGGKGGKNGKGGKGGKNAGGKGGKDNGGKGGKGGKPDGGNVGK
jgi:hypothetical protein